MNLQTSQQVEELLFLFLRTKDIIEIKKKLESGTTFGSCYRYVG